MNERIEELSLEANAQTGNEFDLNHKPLDAFLEKFAELIVRECMQLCKKQSLHYAETVNQGSSTSAAEVCRIIIKEHFGVKE